MTMLYFERIGRIRSAAALELDDDAFTTFEALCLDVTSFDELRNAIYSARRSLQYISDLIERDWVDEVLDEGKQQ